MAEFKIPDLGENVDGGDVVGILISVGDTIEVDQDVLELETDKATLTVPSSVAGVVQSINVSEGDHVEVGQVILVTEGSANGASQKAPAQAEAASPPPAEQKSPAPTSSTPSASGPVEFKVPDLGENVEGGDVVGILVAEGDTIKVDQDVLELETDKATLTVPSSVAGTISKIHISEGDHLAVGQVILTVQGEGAAAPTPPQQSQPAAAAPATESPSQPATDSAPQSTSPAPAVPTASPFTPSGETTRVPAAPNVRRLARELGIDVTEIPPGEMGRVTINDLKAHSRQINQNRPAAQSAAPSAAKSSHSKPLPDFSKWGEVETEKMSGIRRATARQMAYAWETAPRVTQFDKADIGDLETMRKKYGQRLEKSGAKLTVTAILLKVTAAALKQFPKFNASIDVEQEQVIYKKYFNIGVAVDTPYGLVVPVIREVDRKNIFELAVELGEVAVKARDRKLSVEEMQGGCFTISNLGGIGGTNFTPIVNAPEVAILGVARGGMEPVYNKESGQFEPHLMMPLSLSYDHRLIDGAEGARFLRWLCQALEDPMMMSLQAW